MNFFLKRIAKLNNGEYSSDVNKAAIRSEILRLGEVLGELEKATVIKDFSSEEGNDLESALSQPYSVARV